MASNTRDVDLVIRAKAEGERALKAITDGLKDLAAVQASVAKSGKQADGALDSLGAELSVLSKQVQNLSSFKTLVENVDRAGAAVERLEGRAAQSADELALLAQRQTEAAAATAKARVAAEQAAAAYQAQQQQAAAVRKEAGKTSEAYQQQAAAQQQAKQTRETANSALKDAERVEQALQKQVSAVTAALAEQKAAVEATRGDWNALKQQAQLAGQSLGGVEADLGAVTAAANVAAEKLKLAKGAIDFRVEADNAKKLRDAAAYIGFWTKALNEKEVAERQAAQTTARVLQPSLADQINQSLGIGRQPGRSAARAADTFAPLLKKQDIEQEAQATEAAARAARDLASAEEMVRRALDPLLPIRQVLEKQLRQVNLLYKQGRISALEMAQAEKVLREQADEAAQALAQQSVAGGKGTFLGLRPYELHSLSYQINDVFTQLGSGTPVMQVLAQQGGQVFQVFQRQLLPVAAKFGPALAAAKIEIGLLISAALLLGAAFKNAGDEALSLKQFTAQLALNADGAAYNAKALAETAHQLDVYDGSLKDAREAIKLFINEGLNLERVEQFGMAAQDLAKVTGKDVPDAARLLAEGFTGGYNAIKKLDEQFNFLTAQEREHIKAMFDSGNVARGRTEAFDLFYGKIQKGADAMRGPWGEAMRNFAGFWNNIVEWLRNTAPVKLAIELVGDLAKGLKDLTDRLPGAQGGQGGTPGATPEVSRVERDLTELRERRVRAIQREADALGRLAAAKKADPDNAATLQRRFNEARARMDAGDSLDSVAALDRAIQAKEQRLAELRKSSADTVATRTESDKKALADVLGQISEEELRREQTLKTTTDADKIRIAGELAYRQAIRETGDVAEETARKIADARRKAAEAQVREQQANALSISSYAKRVAGVESNGDNNARPVDKDGNLLSSALGQGQFIESTWLALFKKHFPTEAARMSDSAILELRKRQEYSLKLIEIYAQENARVLQKAGISVNEVALYLAHFLGPKGATKLLSAAPNTPVSRLLGQDQIAANQKVLGGKTAGQVIAFAQRKMGASEAEREQLDDEAEVRNRIAEALRRYNQELDDASGKRKAEIGALQELKDIESLSLEQKYAIQRQSEIARALEDARQKAAEAGTTLSAARERQIRSEVGALYDLQNAEELHNAQMREKRDFISDLIGKEQQRETLLNELEVGRRSGTIGRDRMEELRAEIQALNDQVAQGLPTAEAYARALGDERLLAQLDKVRVALANQREGMAQVREIMDGFVSGAVNAFDALGQSIAAGVKPLKALRSAFLQFAADFLRQISLMILKQTILNLVSGFFSAGGAGGAGAGAGGGTGYFASPTIAHTGGLIGSTSLPTKSAPSAWFANAARYHTGGVIGLGPDEVPIIAKRNEEMLTENDPRHRFNLGKGETGGGRAPINLKVVNAIDPGDFISQGLGTTAGEEAIMNFMRANAAGVKAALG